MKSILQQGGAVPFAAFLNERVYMREFYKKDGLPAELQRWQPTVDAMLDGVDSDGPIFLMVDQAVVRAGDMHRRGGAHIDGHWIPAIQTHGGYGGHGMPSRGGHRPLPTAPAIKRQVPEGSHGRPAAPVIKRQDERDVPHSPPEFEFAPLHSDEGLILASNYTGCRGYEGEFEGVGQGGDCSHVDLSTMHGMDLRAGFAYAGNVSFLHESIALPADSLRTVVRLNVPGWTV